MAKGRQTLRGLAGKGKKGYKGIIAAATAVQVVAVALIILVEMVGLMKDRELDLEALGIKKDSAGLRPWEKIRKKVAGEDVTKGRTETEEKI